MPDSQYDDLAFNNVKNNLAITNSPKIQTYACGDELLGVKRRINSIFFYLLLHSLLHQRIQGLNIFES
jgi:hypothetical protein